MPTGVVLPLTTTEDIPRDWTSQPDDDGLVLFCEVVGKAADTTVSPVTDRQLAAIAVETAKPLATAARGVITLRPYQEASIAATKKAWDDGKRAPLVVLATGAGKTLVAATLIAERTDFLGARCLFFAHRRELLDQTADKIRLCGNGRVGIVQGPLNQLRRDVTVVSVQSVWQQDSKRLEALMACGPYSLIVIDEAHHAVSPGYMRVISKLKERFPKADFLGLTATPGRADGTGLDLVFDCVAYEKNLFSLIEEGWLVPPHGFRVNIGVDLAKVDSRDGDFVASQLSKVMNTPPVNRAVVEAWQRYGHNRKMIVYAVDIAHAEALAQEFRDAGYAAASISDKTPAADRKEVLANFRNGTLKLVCNCSILSEGWDDPSTEGIVFARPTQSQSFYTQCVGRSLRLYVGKTESIVIDCVGNSKHQLAQLATLAGFDPLEVNTKSADPTAVAADEEEDDLDVEGATIRDAQEFHYHRPRQPRYHWRETPLGWVIQIPRVGYYIVRFADHRRDQSVVYFYDTRKGRDYEAPKAILTTPVPFDIAYNLVEGEIERMANARSLRQFTDDEEPIPLASFVDLEEGDEPIEVPEELLLPDAAWRERPMTAKQGQMLRRFGIKQDQLPRGAGEASDLITLLRVERDATMRVPATAKQIGYLRVNGIPYPNEVTKGQAMRLIVKHRGGSRGTR
jgi:superfamily II DNA or RNA helicase